MQGNGKTLLKPELRARMSVTYNQAAGSLFLLSSLCIGGSERKMVRIANALCDRGRKIHVGYFSEPETLLEEIDQRIPVVNFHRTGKYSVGATLRLKRYVLEHGISQIVCVNLYPLLYASALRLWLSNVYRVVCVNTTRHVDFKDRLFMMLYAPLVRQSHRVVFGCRAQQDEWLNRYRLHRARCEYIYNGVDLTRFSPRAVMESKQELCRKYGLGADNFLVGSVTHLTAMKQPKDLIQAVEGLRAKRIPVQAIIVGEGEQRTDLERFVRLSELGDAVFFLGEMRDVRPALAMMDAFVLTSVSETFSNAALEAMAMSKPVVLSRVGGAEEMVVDGKNGYLFEKGDVDSLTEVLLRMTRDKQSTMEVGMRGRETVEAEFSFPVMVDHYEALLRYGVSARIGSPLRLSGP
jgi:glycosyltransferase involved in cell wall biosynthesis